MTVEDIRENLQREMDTIFVEHRTESALNRLMYTAYETGIFPFKMHGEFIELIQLVTLAERFKHGIPEELDV